MKTKLLSLKYSGEFIQHGYLIITPTTGRWDKQRQAEADYEERRRIFTNFRTYDDGRSRIFIDVCSTPDEAKEIVEKHNREVMNIRKNRIKMRSLRKKINILRQQRRINESNRE